MKAFNVSRILAAFAVLLMLFSIFSPALGTAYADGLKRPTQRASAKVGSSLAYATGVVHVVVQLKEQPLIVNPGQNRHGQLKATQDNLSRTLTKYGATEVARMTNALNAIVIKVDSSKIEAISKELNVKSINLIGNYSLDLSETVPYIGGTAAQALGYTGKNLKVAVLDSGVDYTHKAFGGAGTKAAYQAAYGTTTSDTKNKTLDGLFPTPKVYAGYDFVGEAWPGGGLSPDPDPIDCGTPGLDSGICSGGHGTHVSDIIAGVSRVDADGKTRSGVAPDAKIMAIRVCSAVSSSCSGIALLQGVDYALDPNGDHNLADKVDVMNLSLGSDYGQIEDDLTLALNNAANSGVVVVTSAGNGSDRPYKVGSPSIAASVISVAQTAVPGDKLYPINTTSPAGLIKYSVLQAWSKTPTGVISGPVQYGNGAGGNLLGCDALPAGSLTGKILLVDRGMCNVSAKGLTGQNAGALAVIVANNQPGEPPSFSSGGITVNIPLFVISQAKGTQLKQGVPGATATIDPANVLPLVGTTVSSSSRGPAISSGIIKPEIAAPGGSISAEVGTGNDTSPFSGTSGAAPMVAGSALLAIEYSKQKGYNLSPLEIKGLLMNTAETNISTLDSEANFYLAPITRIGAGEVRVNRAVSTKTVVTVPSDSAAALSFGFKEVNNTTTVLYKTIRIRNLSSEGRLYTITGDFRYADDKNNGAVSFQSGFPRSEWVEANSSRDIQLQLQISGPQLRTWNLNASTGGNAGVSINELEYDGYITVTGGGDKATLPWEVFPRKVADVQVQSVYDSYVYPQGNTKVMQLSNNLGAGPGRAEVFNLLGTSPQITTPAPAPGSNEARIDLRSYGVREKMVSGVLNLEFGITTFGKRATPNYPAEFDIYLDTTGDGLEDYVIFNQEVGGFGLDGRNMLSVYKLNAPGIGFKFQGFSDATYNSENMIFSVPAASMGLSSGSKFGSFLLVFDNYFTGNQTDYIIGPAAGGYSTYTLGAPRFQLDNLPWTQAGVLSADKLTLTITTNGAQIEVKRSGTTATSTSNGVLLLYRDGGARESEAVVIT